MSQPVLSAGARQPTEPVPSDAAPGRGSPQPGAARRSARRAAEISLYVGPALILYVLFVLLPIGLAVYYSLYKWNGLGPLTEFIGFDNYRRALDDEVFRGAITHNGIIVVLSIAIQGLVGIGLALLLNQRMRGRAALRAVYFAPYILSEVVTAVTWLLMLQPDGLVDTLLRAVGLGDLIELWLADTSVVLYTMFVVITWKYIGFAIILFLAGLQAIPQELIEAAAIDGAGRIQTIRRITLPLLGPTIRIWAFLSIIGSLQLFDLIWIMTLGGPANASNTMATYMIDRGFQRYEFGYGSAVAVILFVISFVVALAYQRFVLRRDTEGALTRNVR
ncbi:carbohydrate ABC transporter permease [Plantactinospora soyae]|uniref:Raffinose/stachyose/melibiose transport system permease protein n=1 Tax=Plantactinospora soyae TaxID=1544732 RepID=A0A927M648_9ACTN|nr:sugar ABC transporter permease [Plantactinospora soyae]MBE1488694.1 raffinose/stachyose/melibiose transport system permease protein [Plantactinospora soyae]